MACDPVIKSRPVGLLVICATEDGKSGTVEGDRGGTRIAEA